MALAEETMDGNSKPNFVRGLRDLTLKQRRNSAPVNDVLEHVHRIGELPEIKRRGRLLGAHDRFQIWLWERLIWRIAKITNVAQPHHAPSENDYVRPIPVERRYPSLVGAPLIFSEATPTTERHRIAEIAVIRATLWLKEWYGLGESLTQPYTSIGAPYPSLFEKIQPKPLIPDDFQVEDRLAGVARRGPFSFQTKQIANDEFVIDLSALDYLETRKPFVATGGLARFARDGSNSLRTLDIEFRGQKFQPGTPGWTLAERRFLSALNNHTTVVEHLVWLHIATAGVWGIVGRQTLSARHPLRYLLQPFSEETNRVNNYNIDGLILTERSNVPTYTGYTLEQSSRLIVRAGQIFDIRRIDAEYRAREQGQLDDATFPTVNSAVEVFRIYRRFTSAWCKQYLSSPIDLETRAFVEQLDVTVANGVRKLIGIDRFEDLTLEHVAHLLAVGAFASSIGHHIVNDLTRDYYLSFHLMAPAINAEGRSTLGVVLEKLVSVVSAGVQRYKLLSQPVLPDEQARRIWDDFQSELKNYEARIADHPQQSYLIHPSKASSSIHA